MLLPQKSRKIVDPVIAEKRRQAMLKRAASSSKPFALAFAVVDNFCLGPTFGLLLESFSAYGEGTLSFVQMGEVLYKAEVKGMTSIQVSSMQASFKAPLMLQYIGEGSCQICCLAKIHKEEKDA